MATSGIINGTNMLVFIDTGLQQPIGYSTSCNLSITHETRNTTNSTSGGWNTRMAGNRDWEVSCDALVSMVPNPTNSANLNFYNIFHNYINNRQKFWLKFGNQIASDYYYEGQAFCTGLEISASNEESTTYSVSFVAAGPLYQYTNP